MGVYDDKPCPCGSGLRREPNFDGHSIFLKYTCSSCHAKAMRGYRPDIMERYQCDEPIEPEE